MTCLLCVYAQQPKNRAEYCKAKQQCDVNVTIRHEVYC